MDLDSTRSSVPPIPPELASVGDVAGVARRGYEQRSPD